jgi:hypothetical protein
MNLAVNSRDAMPNGGQLIIETSAVDFDESIPAQSIETRPGPFVCLSVSDTGYGITSENLPRVFEPIRMELTEQQVRERDDGSSINLPKSGRKRVQTLFAGYKLHFAVTDFIFQPQCSEIAATRLFDGDAFCQVAGLVDVAAAGDGDVVGE